MTMFFKLAGLIVLIITRHLALFDTVFDEWQKRFGAINHAPKIDIHHPFKLLNTSALYRRREGHACIVKDEIDFAMVAHHAIRPRLHSVIV
jgi:hypothetical protein